MTEDKTITDNEVIARFMGYFNWEDSTYGNYDKDWNRLMPVWYKFRDLKFNAGDSIREHSRYKRAMELLIPNEGISETFSALVEAVKWYNSLKKPTEVGEFFKNIPKGKYDQHYKGEPR